MTQPGKAESWKGDMSHKNECSYFHRHVLSGISCFLKKPSLKFVCVCVYIAFPTQLQAPRAQDAWGDDCMLFVK